MIEWTHRGVQTDDQGRFLIDNVTAGRVVVMTQQVGFRRGRDTVLVRPGETTRLNVVLLAPCAVARDSLLKIGKWPIFDSTLARRIEACESLNASRLETSRTTASQPRTCPTAWRDTLMAALRAADFASPALGIHSLCECQPEVRIDLSGCDTPCAISLCYFCGLVSVESGGARQDAFFGEGRDRFLRFVHTVFNDDPELSHVESPQSGDPYARSR